jgi:hypothetical protein
MRLKGKLVRAYISTHKAEFARLTMKRIVRFWDGSSESPAPMTVMLALLGFVGLTLALHQRRRIALLVLPIAIYPLPFYITHPNARYQFVIDPLLVIFAAHACECFLAFIARSPLPAPAISTGFASDQPSSY